MFNLYTVVTVSLPFIGIILGMEMSMFTFATTLASNAFEARHFVLKFMQICKNIPQCLPMPNIALDTYIHLTVHFEQNITLTFKVKNQE